MLIIFVQVACNDMIDCKMRNRKLEQFGLNEAIDER